jgi:hypothetical protein
MSDQDNHSLQFWCTAKQAVLAVMLALFFLPLALKADLPEEQPSSRDASLGYSGIGLIDGWSLFRNQAGLGYQDFIWVGAHHENRFITPELNFSAIGLIVPVKMGAFGISLKRLGFNLFSQSKLGLAYGMKLAPTLSAGVQLNAHQVYVAGEYGSVYAVTAEGGILYSPSKNLNVGFHVANPTRSKISEDERIPTIINLGLAYQLSEMVLVTGAVEKNLDANFSFKAGLEFVPIKNLSFRTGMATNPSQICFGLGYQISSVQMDIAFTRHAQLGYTPHFSVSYVFDRGKRKGDTPD